MKKPCGIILFLLLAMLEGTAQFELIPDSLLKPAETRRADNLVVDFNLDNWMDAPNDVKVRTYSLGFNAYLMHDIQFGNSNFSFAIGGGVSSHNVHSNGEFINLIDSIQGTTYTNLKSFAPTYNYKKNKLSTNYIDVPLELRFKSKGTANVFRMAVGFKAGYLVNIHSKTRDDDGLRKGFIFDNALEYRYGITGRIGFGKLNLTGYYALTPLFQEGKGVELTPYSIGLSVFVF